MHRSISRRTAAKLIGGTAAGALLPIGASRLVAAAQSTGKILRPIPSTGEKLPVIGLGSASTFDVPPGSAQARTVGEMLAQFLKRGGKLVDTSPMYGTAETVI